MIDSKVVGFFVCVWIVILLECQKLRGFDVEKILYLNWSKNILCRHFQLVFLVDIHAMVQLQ